MLDLIIIGGGPAALSAASYALGKQLDVRVISIERGGKTGAHQRLVGQIGEEHLAGEEAVRLLEQEVTRSGRSLRDRVTQVTRSETLFRVETHANGVLESRAVIVATGAQPIMLDVPGAQEFLGQGLGYSVTTHSQLLAGKTAAVIGATDRAFRGVAELAQTAAQVYLIAPHPALLRGSIFHTVQRCRNVEVIEGYAVTEITGAFNVEEVVIQREQQTRRLAVDAAFVDLGLVPNSDLVRALVQIDDGGFIKIDDRNGTAARGLFAAGDVTNALGEQKLIAVGEGARAGWSAYEYVLLQRLARAH